MGKQIDFLDTVELFEQTMSEQYNHGDGKNSILVVAVDEVRTLCACFGAADKMSMSMAHAALEDDRLAYLIISAAKRILENSPMALLKLLAESMQDDEEGGDDDDD